MDESRLNIDCRHKNHSSARHPHTSSNLFHCCSANYQCRCCNQYYHTTHSWQTHQHRENNQTHSRLTYWHILYRLKSCIGYSCPRRKCKKHIVHQHHYQGHTSPTHRARTTLQCCSRFIHSHTPLQFQSTGRTPKLCIID